jgi:hypothetical protein
VLLLSVTYLAFVVTRLAVDVHSTFPVFDFIEAQFACLADGGVRGAESWVDPLGSRVWVADHESDVHAHRVVRGLAHVKDDSLTAADGLLAASTGAVDEGAPLAASVALAEWFEVGVHLFLSSAS